MRIEYNLLNSFLLVYFYEIEKMLNNSNNNLREIKFQSEESNTDEFLKRYFKEFLLKNNTIKNSTLQKLIIRVDDKEYCIDISELHNYKICNVLLPEELTLENKLNISTNKKSVYTNPDLYLHITDGVEDFFEPLELKSTKNNNIPGSSIQQVSPFEWVVFVRRNDDNVIVTTGYYLNTITNKLPFPDRSPRPQIGFNTLKTWNEKYRKELDDTLTFESISEINKDKINLLKDWQDYLAKEWLEIIQAENLSRNEKWFNNALRKFTIKFLDYTDKLSKGEKAELKNKLLSQIK